MSAGRLGHLVCEKNADGSLSLCSDKENFDRACDDWYCWWSQHVAAHASLIALSDQDTIGNLTFYNSLIVITLGAFRFTSRRAKRPDSTHWCGPKDFRLTRQ